MLLGSLVSMTNPGCAAEVSQPGRLEVQYGDVVARTPRKMAAESRPYSNLSPPSHAVLVHGSYPSRDLNTRKISSFHL
jgi:hypothetical protein